MEQGDFVPIVDFIQTYNNKLKERKILDIKRTDLMILSFLELADDLLESKYGVITGRTLDEVLVRKIKEQGIKRTGILKGILSFKSTFYQFEYSGKGDKEGRLYVTRYVNILGSDYVFLITLDPDILNEKDANELLQSLQDDFYELINKATNLEYNKDIK
ncbi:hypothetical protein [Brevibacillus brevis]|uniref:hypothetical protein n=1 Tax=Brevibacillus brevis TaxID=1393 RepID=UPI000D0FA42A|nr:hypothetical protein [Brevibacillus brevis]PSJ70233.1 hypothetical protein C7J99_06670 [Brevibacillus brevis]RED30118.1 hypothetical protein DES34_105337 [Brevibacillus brevis]GEC88143.1 hypothetical protein BBR01nite_04740 [Brevibacillus brevis]VEF88665.1 Uncharacterised protein [Brevibacillus brevis]